jgi:aminoglycoside phosphotransferase (APT) family kinase protein
MYSFVTFAETALGAVAIKRATGPWLAALRRERTVLDALRTSALPVPECLLYMEDETAQPATGWLVMPRFPGQPLLELLRKAEGSSMILRALRNFGQTVAQLHALDVPPELDSGSAPWLETMLEQAEANLALGLGEGDRAQLEELKHKRPAPVMPTFIHGDLFLDNVLSDGVEITGLIDWAFGALGDPRYDLALAMYGMSDVQRAAFLEGYGLTKGLSQFETEYFLKLAIFW